MCVKRKKLELERRYPQQEVALRKNMRAPRYRVIETLRSKFQEFATEEKSSADERTGRKPVQLLLSRPYTTEYKESLTSVFVVILEYGADQEPWIVFKDSENLQSGFPGATRRSRRTSATLCARGGLLRSSTIKSPAYTLASLWSIEPITGIKRQQEDGGCGGRTSGLHHHLASPLIVLLWSQEKDNYLYHESITNAVKECTGNCAMSLFVKTSQLRKERKACYWRKTLVRGWEDGKKLTIPAERLTGGTSAESSPVFI
ncbi:hypothetical protein C8R45DRAFT_931344 [Mycena sanguinolenta]|nr:hypothetical protein C8R45DRAFT_931344 [Mycena sanguinolenta]